MFTCKHQFLVLPTVHGTCHIIEKVKIFHNMDKVLLENNDKQCRLCLGKPKFAFAITDNNKFMIESLTSIQLNIDEPIFSVICCKCNSDLKYINKVLKKFQEADVKLKKWIETGESDLILPEIKIKTDNLVSENEDVIIKQENEIVEHSITIDIPEKPTNNSTNYWNSYVETCEQRRRKILEEWLETYKKPTDETKPFKLLSCDVCDKKFTHQRDLTRHSYTHQRKECQICHAIVTRTNLLTHMKIHNSQPVVCEICGTKMKNQNSLRGHYIAVHGEGKTCEYCGRRFTRPFILQLHIKKFHLKAAKELICETCGKSFYTKFTLNLHIQRIHEKKKPYSCSYCNRKFSTCTGRRTHERQHTNEMPYKCEMCGEAFRQKVSLRSHRKSKHNIVELLTETCPICSKQFPSETALATHTYKMHPS